MISALHDYAPAIVVCCTFYIYLADVVGHLFKVFRSVSLDFTGYVYNYGPLEASKLKQVMLSVTLPDIDFML